MLARIDDDPGWHPGNTCGGKVGRAKALSGTATASIARSAMSLKEACKEPTYRRVVSSCPKAVLNPATGKPVSKKRVYDVFREQCFDEEAELPWKHRPRLVCLVRCIVRSVRRSIESAGSACTVVCSGGF